MNDEKLEELETSLIEICNYIGLNMEIEHAKRWFDIVRRKMGGAPYNVFSASGLEGAKTNFNPDRDYLYPLPNDELLRNPNLLPQNPNY